MAGQGWQGRIEGLTHEGVGVGTVVEKVGGKSVRRPIFIPFTAPGDLVRAKISGQRGKYLFGEMNGIVEASPSRVQPRCPHFGVCGGCNLQHIKYEEQLAQKAQQVAYLLGRKGIALPCKPKVLPSRKLHKYRWRARVFAQFSDGACTAGFRRMRSHEIVPVSTCFIVAPQILEAMRLLKEMQPRLGEFTLTLIMVIGEKGKVALLVPIDEVPADRRKEAKEFFEEFYARHRDLIGNLFFEEGRAVRTSGQVQEHSTYSADGLTFSFLPETFIQSNIPTNEVLIREALRMLAPARDQTVIDLYAGIGNFSLPIAKRAKAVVAVEGFEASVVVGRTNALRNGLGNVTFLHRSTERYLKEYGRRKGKDAEHPAADAILLDPPRTGCEQRELLLGAGVARIVYVSCNPVTLADDLAVLCKGYEVRDIICVDMFPDVSHVETVVLLERK